jgi:FAD/FMN-containing dehydrogenase
MTNARGLEGDTVDIGARALHGLAARISGSLITAEDSNYEPAREVWNARVDARPALIVRCANAQDVSTAVRFAKQHGIRMSVRGGGHSAAGYGVCEGGVMVDLSHMQAVTVDPVAGIARVEGGATWASVDKAASRAGLATTGAIVSTTGVGGFTLGGGLGWFHRSFGLGCDNLASAEVVTADGRIVTANPQVNPDLFWALRGGGGNFGAVVHFSLRLHHLAGRVRAGLLYFPIGSLPRIAGVFDRMVAEAPAELGFCLFLRRAPTIPELSAEVHGAPVLAVAVCAPERSRRTVAAIEEFRQAGPVLADLVGTRHYVEWQQALDPAWDRGLQNYWMGHYFDAVSGGAVGVLTEYLSTLDSPRTDVKIFALGGAVARRPSQRSAFGGRDAASAMVIQARWERTADTARQIAWTRALHAALSPSARPGVYVNFVGDAARVRDAYPPAILERLREVKTRWDPENLFRANLNISPHGGPLSSRPTRRVRPGEHHPRLPARSPPTHA